MVLLLNNFAIISLEKERLNSIKSGTESGGHLRAVIKGRFIFGVEIINSPVAFL